MKIIIENNDVTDIPVLNIYPENKISMPVVIFLHGYGASKEQGVDFGYRLAKSGFFFICFDSIEHGDRQDKSSQEKYKNFKNIYPGSTGLDTYIHMHEIIVSTQKDINIIIDKLQNNQRVDINRVGLTGFSMGGFATFYNAAESDFIKAAVPIAGKPAFKKAWDNIILATASYDQWSDQIKSLSDETEKRTKFMEKIDPIRKIFNFAPKPMLIINGDQDTDQPYLYSLELYKELLPYYGSEPKKLKLSMPFVGHFLTEEIKEKACSWFKMFL